jgi:hypothetical protein
MAESKRSSGHAPWAMRERKTPAVVVAAAALHFRAVGLGQRPVASELLFPGIFG